MKKIAKLAAGALLVGVPAGVWADDHDEDELEWDEAFVFFELNDTDGDLGIHAKIDGDEWKRLQIENDEERRILDIRVRGNLREQGLTEIFFESAEPTFDELAPEEFFARFPEGEYEVEGLTLDGEEIESDAELTHLLPAPPQPLVNGMPFDTDCDDDVTTVVSGEAPIVLSWAAVTESHPTLGRTGESVTVENYEVVVEIDDTPWKASAVLPPDTPSFTVPAAIVALSDEIKYEILVRESSYNQTATESCFEVE